jgi:type IX secretion system PorP/SprF family membrane protein
MKATQLLNIIFICLGINADAQDPIHSQNFATPTFVNPAFTGVFDGSYRIQGVYRNQWSSILGNRAFETMSFSLDHRRPIGRNDSWGLGIQMQRDQAGQSNFTRQNVGLTGAYTKQLSGGRYSSSDHYLVAGGGLGLGQNSVDWGALWFSNQYDPSKNEVDPSRSSRESNQNNTTGMFMDIQAGLMYYAILEDDFNYHLGVAMHHINQPNVSFLSDGNQVLNQRITINAGAQIPFNKNLSLLPVVLYTNQGLFNQLNGGAAIRFTSRDWDEAAVRFGTHMRMTDRLGNKLAGESLIFFVYTELLNFNFGVSYDATVSSLSVANQGRGAFEASLGYIWKPLKRKTKVKCPKY